MGTRVGTRAAAVTPEDFVAFYENPDLARRVFTPDAVYDANIPSWRFQYQGPEAIAAHVREANPLGDLKAAVLRSTLTVAGWVAELEYVYTDAHGIKGYYRALFNAELTDGKISELVLYCTGLWTDETRARHAAEAPMIRA